VLAKKYRLPLQDFAGKRSQHARRTVYFSIKVFPATLPHSRFGVVVSGKVSKSAVRRNQLKRSIFDWLRQKQSKLPVADYVIIVFPEAARLPKADIAAEAAKLFS